MAEYFEREATIMRIEEVYCADCNSYNGVRCRACGTGDAIDMIEDAPAADVAPVVHGRWDEVDWVEMESGGQELIRTPNAALRCSNCRNCFKKELLWKNNYCPNCGAKMDGGADHEAD